MAYFMGGASVGALTWYVVHGRFYDLMHKDAAVFWVLPANLILLPILVALWRHRESEGPRMTAATSASMLFLHRVPFNKRMAFLVFAIVWIIGIVVPIVYGP